MSSSAGPPSNSGENVVDLVRRGGFFLHSLMEKRASGREELLCEKKDYRKGRGRWLRWESDGAWTRAGIHGSTSLQKTTRTQVVLADRPRGRSGQSEEESHLTY